LSKEFFPTIIFEDNDLLVLDKPAGLVVNKSPTTPEGTLQDFLVEKYPDLFSVKLDKKQAAAKAALPDFIDRAGIVHRLDKDTSGVIVVAKTPQAFSNLQKQFKSRGVQKEYIALVAGIIEDKKVEIEAPIGRNPKKGLKFAVVSSGRDAQTYVEKIEEVQIEGRKYSLIKVEPKTGRTHQIRVHLAAMNHPVAGDKLYSRRKDLKDDDNIFGRMMLHAIKIGFKHPKSNEDVSFESPSPPEFKL
jgi:23S rRNA pseudouridine1911/1915/1917 synthase